MSKRKLSEAHIWLVDFLREKMKRDACSDPTWVVTEHQFAAPRRWRFDVAILYRRIAFEIEGGVWTRGRHVRGDGFLRDAEKYNTATARGWKVFRFTPEQILSGKLKEFCERENL